MTDPHEGEPMTDETTPDAVEARDPLDGLEQFRRIIDKQPEPAPESVMLGLDYCYAEWVAERARHAEEVAALRDLLRKVERELDGERERATKMEAELADRRAHDEDVRMCLEYCDEDDPTPGGIGGLARELLEWFSGRAA